MSIIQIFFDKNEHCQEYTIPVLQPGSDHVQNLDINCINKIIRQELEESEHARQMKIFNRTIEPKEYSCRLYKAVIGTLPLPNAA